jgi:hypothetical protein
MLQRMGICYLPNVRCVERSDKFASQSVSNEVRMYVFSDAFL